MTETTTSLSQPAAVSSRLTVASVVFLMGAAVVFVTGFAHPQALHDAAHDARHALSFPCH
ncbi:CbtB domain-containing protein [Tepidamorphus gemmatus]|nr:CbtB domain-containing protein [Tepidamorphus gemmatus]